MDGRAGTRHTLSSVRSVRQSMEGSGSPASPAPWSRPLWWSERLCAYGSAACDMASCVALGFLVLATDSPPLITVFSLPRPDEDMRLLRRIGADYAFGTFGGTGLAVAFTVPGKGAGPPLLLVADRFHGEVHVVDATTGAYRGKMADRRWSMEPCAVATCENTVAVVDHLVSMDDKDGGVPRGYVWLFEGAGTDWHPTRRLEFRSSTSPTVRFMPDGLRLVVGLVCKAGNPPVVCLYDRAGEGPPRRVDARSAVRFMGHVAEQYDYRHSFVEPCGEDGKLLVGSRNGLWIVSSTGGDACRFMKPGPWTERFAAVTTVPGLGLLLLFRGVDGHYHLDVHGTPDAIAQAAMSAQRVAWMGAVARCVLERARRRGNLAAARAGAGAAVRGKGRAGKRLAAEIAL